MKVLMQNSPNVFPLNGGTTIQMLKTKEELEHLGVQVDISLEPAPVLAGYDLVHVFNILPLAMPFTYQQITNAKKWHVPVALSPVYWSLAEHDQSAKLLLSSDKKEHQECGIWGRLNSILQQTLGIQVKRGSSFAALGSRIRIEENNRQKKETTGILQESSLLMADILLPNSQQEVEHLRREFKWRSPNYRVIYNGADKIFYRADGSDFSTKYGLKDFVLCVGRLEHRKNQLMLVRALKGTGLPVVLAGKKPHSSYWEKCQKEADGDVLVLDHTPHELLPALYGAAKVHVLPSWTETPGLANLEAALAGCNIVVTDRGSTREYFRDYAWYCEPGDSVSIRNATLDAFYSPRRDGLPEYILRDFSWEKAARQTLDAYKSIVQSE